MLLLIGVSVMFQYLIGLYQVADLTVHGWRRCRRIPVILLINLILFVSRTFTDMASTYLSARRVPPIARYLMVGS